MLTMTSVVVEGLAVTVTTAAVMVLVAYIVVYEVKLG